MKTTTLILLWVLMAVLTAGSSWAQDIPEVMVLIDQGAYTPLYQTPYDTSAVTVDAFYLDVYPVTNADFLAFVKANPRWLRSQVTPLFTDENYLNHWDGDLALGDTAPANSPVVNVSWFAAMAYAEWAAKRLPTMAEWEYVAAASASHPDGSTDPDHYQRIIDWYAQPTPARTPSIGSTVQNYWQVYDMHGLVWEWVYDFNNAFVTGESRSDSDLDRQRFCGSGSIGASDFKDYAAFMRFAFRGSLEGAYTTPNLGFRCARDQITSQPKAK